MQNIITDYLHQAKVGRKQSYKNLAIYPLLSTYSLSLDYLLLDEALTEGVIDIVEVDKDGSVPDLKVINKSPRMVLILDGEELVGAKQNRIVNTTILIQGNTDIVIPVSCVEQGRWSYDSPRFSTKRRVMSPHLRAMKSEQVHYSLRSSGRHMSDQGVIWNEISEKATRHAAESPIMSMAHIYEKDATSIDEYVKHFRLIDSQIGAAFMINGKVVGMDSVGKAETFSNIFKKLFQSYALDAIDWYDPAKEQKALKSEITKFIKASQAAQVESHPPVGQGIDLRMESRKITGFALSLDDRILHLCIFARENGRNGYVSGSRMGRFSARRRNRGY